MDYVAGKLLEYERSVYGQTPVGWQLFGQAMAIKYLQGFDTSHELTEREYSEYVRMLHRRQRRDEQFPLIAL